MAKKAYVGVNGQPHNGTALYVGVNNVPRKVVKGYVGVNGVPCVFWDKTAPPVPVIESWDYWSAKDNQIIRFVYRSVRRVYKDNKKIAYYGAVKAQGAYDVRYTNIIISPDSDAVINSVETRQYTSRGTITDANNITWYVAGFNEFYSSNDYTVDPSGCLLNDTVYALDGYLSAAQDLLDRVYAVPFQSDYQTGQTYTLQTTNIEHTVRKALGTWLHSNINAYATNQAYAAISDNADTIIDYIVNMVRTKCGTSIIPLMQIMCYSGSDCAIYVQFGTSWSIGNTDRVTGCSLTGTTSNRGYDVCYFETFDYPPDPDYGYIYERMAYPDWLTLIGADISGNLTYTTMDAWETQADMIKFAAGLGIEKPSGSNFYNVEMTNLGINL